MYLNKTVTICLLNEQVFCAVPVGTGDHPLFRFVALQDAGNRELCTSLCPIGELHTFFLNATSPCGRCLTHASSLCTLCCVTRERPVTQSAWSRASRSHRKSCTGLRSSVFFGTCKAPSRTASGSSRAAMSISSATRMWTGSATSRIASLRPATCSRWLEAQSAGEARSSPVCRS